MLKQIIFYSTCLSLVGCQTIIPKVPTSSNLLNSSGCSAQPRVSLSSKDVETLTLDQETITRSGEVSVSQHVGYTFTATAGEKLSYSTDADVCLWVFTPDNQIVKGGDLSKDGKYVIQVAAPEGVKTFNLHLSLGSLQIAVATSTPGSSLNIKTQNDNSSSESNTLKPQNESSSEHDISQEDALQLVQKWYAAKPQIFGGSFDRDLVAQLTMGKIYESITKPGGSIDWLVKNNSYYTYNKSEITQVMGFSNSGDIPYMKVKVLEELYLHTETGIDRKNSGEYEIEYIYFFAKENGTWKIYDSQKQTSGLIRNKPKLDKKTSRISPEKAIRDYYAKY